MNSVQATTPCPRTDRDIGDEWMKRHQSKLREANARSDQIEIVLLGDSITEGWEDEAAQPGYRQLAGELKREIELLKQQ